MNVSIVIPSYGSYHLLDRCLQGIYQNSDVDKLEIIVVCNGSDDESIKLVTQNNLKLIWIREPIGFTKATNLGIKIVTNPITIVMNTDAYIMSFWPKNQWIQKLIQPILDDETVGISGLTRMYSEWGEYTPFFCTAIRSSLFDEIGLLDEDFSPGYGEDLDYCIRARKKRYKVVIAHEGTDDHENSRIVSTFPIYHEGEQSFSKDLRNFCLSNADQVLKRKWG